ncbi:MAG: LOG family protein, partial [Ruaniaceae bacterium]|nr:LOG family protein [Ruaniaceae bacterium]
ELFESLTWVQTHKVRGFPIGRGGTEYWSGLLTWIRETMAGAGLVSPHDLELVSLVDTAEEAVAAIKDGLKRLVDSADSAESAK